LNTTIIESWGRIYRTPHITERPAFAAAAARAIVGRERAVLGFGAGRSYGDVCLNAGNHLIVTGRLDHILAADWQQGVIRAEAGTTLDQILKLAVPAGWFLPVSPGTKFATLAGAVANDVHGKNHETAGTLGRYVKRIGLARSSGDLRELSREEHPGLFAATIGGLGLTGLIVWVELQLVPTRSAYFETETRSMGDLDAFFRLSEESRDWPYTVAWVDCLAPARAVGRGLFNRGRPAEDRRLTVHRNPKYAVSFTPPSGLLNALTIRAFNSVYARIARQSGRNLVHYDPFLYPLDSILYWNRLYGARGFFQHQSVVPMATARETLRRLLELTRSFGQGSFLVVLKLLGNLPSPGLLSFPQPGATLALDFPNKGESTRRLLARMAEIVMDAGGRLYPAKDATMSPEVFRAGYPHWRKLEAQRDPAFMSDFWRRVTEGAA
jgi:L-gulonolactone oxidase